MEAGKPTVVLQDRVLAVHDVRDGNILQSLSCMHACWVIKSRRAVPCNQHRGASRDKMGGYIEFEGHLIIDMARECCVACRSKIRTISPAECTMSTMLTIKSRDGTRVEVMHTAGYMHERGKNMHERRKAHLSAGRRM